jgi:structural toxin protein (hemagglutinin/hemolysin) RtxA
MLRNNLYLISCYVPETNVEQVKNALFQTHAGEFLHYDKCAWQTKGTGQFCPKPGSKPHIGNINQVEQVIEYKIELICQRKHIKSAIQALKASHPYETPAYNVIKLEHF